MTDTSQEIWKKHFTGMPEYCKVYHVPFFVRMETGFLILE